MLGCAPASFLLVRLVVGATARMMSTSAAGSFTAQPFSEKQVTIPMADGTAMDAIIYTPDSVTAVTLFVHGGCFARGNFQSQPSMARALAGAGLVVVYSSYRQGAAHRHPSATNDLMDVARYDRGYEVPGVHYARVHLQICALGLSFLLYCIYIYIYIYIYICIYII